MILKVEFGSLRADGHNIRSQALLLQFRDGPGMNSLRLRRNILRNRFLALGKDLLQSADVGLGTRHFERSPFHEVSCSR